jgi:2'-5' RNA ligase
MRLFFGVSPEGAERARIEGVARAVRAALEGHTLSFSRLEQLHFTLQFLGEVDPRRLADLAAIADAVAARHAPFAVEVDGLGVFPNRRRPSVLFLGVAGGAPLVALAEDLGAALRSGGSAIDARAYHPHLTLARARDRMPPATVAAIGRALDAPWPAGRMRIDRFALVESHLAGALGARHEERHVSSLAGEPV